MPESYQTSKFKDLCQIITKRIDNPREAKTDYYVGLEHLDSEEPKILRHGSPQDVGETKFCFEKGDILFGRRRWYLRKLAVSEKDGICSTDIMVLRPKIQKIIKDFLPILMFGDEFYQKALTISAGSMSPRIRWKELAELVFPIPPLLEQKKIVNLVSRVDNSITKTQQLLEKIETYKTSKADELLTRGIGHKKFKKVKWFFDKTIEIPEEWKVSKFSSKIRMKYGSSLTEKNRDNHGAPVYGSGGIIGFHSKPIVKGPAVLVARKGSLGNTFYETNYFFPIDTVWYITNNETEFNLHFLFYYIKHMKLENYMIVTSKPGLSRSEVYALSVLFPSVQEQTKIASILSNIDKQIKQLEDHLSKLKTMRKSIINEKITSPKEDKIVQ